MKKVAAVIVVWGVVFGYALAHPRPANAQGRPIIDLALVSPTSGTISYDGVGGPLFGLNLDIDSIAGINTPLRDGQTYPCIGCVLSFTSGSLTGYDSKMWFFGAGGSILVTGHVDLNDDDIVDAGETPAGTILAGSFVDTPTVTFVGGSFRILGAAISDTKHDDLTALYGMPGGTYSGGINLSFSSNAKPPAGFNSNLVFSGDLFNAGSLNPPIDTPTPTPTHTAVATPSPTLEATATATMTPTNETAEVPTPSPTNTSGDPTPSPTNTNGGGPTSTPTNTIPEPTSTPTNTASSAPTDTDTPTPTATSTEAEPTATPTTASICGNEIVEPGEECDDGNPFSGDGCEPSCIVSSQCNFSLPIGNTFYVNDDMSGGPPADCQDAPFTTIQAAIDSPLVTDGDVILVCPGTYMQSVTVTKELTLKSTNGAADTILHTDTTNTIDLRRSATRIEGFTLIAQRANAIDANQICPIAEPACANPGRGSNIVIANNVIKDSEEGIDWSGRIDCVDIIDNAFADNGKHILIDHLVTDGGPSVLVNILRNMVDRGGMISTPGITVLGNEAIIERNEIRDAVKDALLVGTATFSVRLNTIELSGDDAIVVVSDGIICARVPPGGLPRPCLQIIENNLYNNDSDGIRVLAGQQTVDTGIHCNNFEGNGVGLGNEATSGQLDATLNWWGSNTGPSGVQWGPGNTLEGLGDKIENRSGATTLFIEFLCARCPIGLPSVNGVCTLIGISAQFPGYDPDVDPVGTRVTFISTDDLDNDPRTLFGNDELRDEVYLLTRRYPAHLGDKPVCEQPNPPRDKCGLCIGGTRTLQPCMTDGDCPADLDTDPIILNGDCVMLTQISDNPNSFGLSHSPRVSFRGNTILFESRDDLIAGLNPNGVMQVFKWNAKIFNKGSGAPLSLLTNGLPGQDSNRGDIHLLHAVLESSWDPLGSNTDGNFEIFQYNNRRQEFYQITFTEAPVQNHRPVGRRGKPVLFDSNGNLDNDPKTTISNADGNREIFLARRGRKQIRITQMTNSVAPVENRAGGLGFHDRLAAFTSNGNYTGQNNDGNFEIFTVFQGVVTQVTVSSSGENVKPVMNGRARFIAFESTADLVGNGASNRRVFLFDRKLNALTQLSASSIGDNRNPRISNGRYVVWDSNVDLNTNPPTLLPKRVIYQYDRKQDD